MIGLDFVKSVDIEWKKHIKYVDGSKYNDNYCPLSQTKCRFEDCSFWNHESNFCGYSIGKPRNVQIPQFEKDNELEEIENFLNKFRIK